MENHPKDHSESQQTDSKSTASLQFMSGKHIGRVLPLKDPMICLGKPGEGVAIIAKRKEGYVVTVLEDENLVSLNQEVIGKRSLTLKDGDTLQLSHTEMQFYITEK